ncbi:hypothetical protein LTR56_022164 [Elasticomyces elasticus]|nr:hypothetical protein LTR56_022164 [Elasticomyces elasticus]KAK3628621.1 hypothetical protein LTR22_022306 [Elasticomyces elasticus]KAK4913412.1 hypothetical protein LTR49_018300 [Elasticomyces elasticus]KAK5754618.1 hypothetical protein LTS12_015342 [Elasticomyces elasticus]
MRDDKSPSDLSRIEAAMQTLGQEGMDLEVRQTRTLQVLFIRANLDSENALRLSKDKAFTDLLESMVVQCHCFDPHESEEENNAYNRREGQKQMDAGHPAAAPEGTKVVLHESAP